MIAYFLALTESEQLWALVGLLIVLPMLSVVCHEAGHYYAAKLCGIDSEEFALGIGPVFLRTRATPSGCELALRVFPFGGRVTYGERYRQAPYAGRAFMSAAGWMADVLVAICVIAAVYLVGTPSPITTIVCVFFAFPAAWNLLPVTSDGRKTIHYLWLAATEKKKARQTGL